MGIKDLLKDSISRLYQSQILKQVTNMYIPRSVKEGTRRQRSTNPGPNVHVLGLYQKMQPTDGWERFLSYGDEKTTLFSYSLNL